MSSHEQQVDELLSRLNFLAELDARKGDDWEFDQFVFPHPRSPENKTLFPLLGEGVSLQNIVDARRSAGKNTHLLELFGSGQILDNPSAADSITGIRLTDKRYTDRTRSRPAHHDVVSGDIYDNDTWVKLTTHMKEKNIPSIDIAVCTPVGGWGSWANVYPASVYMSIFYPLLQHVYNVLSPDEGTLYSEVPPRMGLTQRDLELWTERMNRRGIQTELAHNSNSERDLMRITKLPDSPSKLVPLIGGCRTPAK